MIENPASSQKDKDRRIAELVEAMRSFDAELTELTGGGVDAVLDVRGGALLLRAAQRKLLVSEQKLQESIELQQTLLDSLPASIALVDPAGVVVHVNSAWHESPPEEGFLGSSCGLGGNYLEACEMSALPTVPDAATIARGILPVLDGREASFAIEYALGPSPEARWFKLAVSALHADGSHGAAVMHIDISEQKAAGRALVASEQRFRELAESMPAMVWSADADGQVDYANGVFFEYTGIPRAQKADVTWVDCVFPEDRQLALARWRTCVTSGEPFEVEVRIHRHADNAFRWFSIQAVPIRGSGGAITKWFGSGLDIHGTKELQERSSRLAKRVSTTLESITDAFFTLDPDFAFTYVNAKAEEILRNSRGELLGSLATEATVFGEDGPFVQQFREAVASGEPVAFDALFEPTGAWLEVKAYPSEEGLAVYFHDVTARREEREELRLLSNSIERLNDIVIITKAESLDAPGPEIVFVNPAFERITGYSAAEAIGKNPRFLHGPKTSEETRKRIRRGLERRVHIHEEIINYTKAGEPYWIELSIQPVLDPEGDLTHFVAVERDITDKKRIEEQFLRSQRLESLGTLAGGIAHDLNNLLAPIVMGVDLLKSQSLAPAQRQLVDEIQHSAHRGTELVRQVLTFSRGTEGERIRLGPDDLAPELKTIVRTSFPKNITFVVEQEPGVGCIYADPTQIQQILVNLAVNARDAMPNGGTLTLGISTVEIDAARAAGHRNARPGHFVVLRVTDTGEGMSPETVARIYEPFFTTKPFGQGTGLGLSTVLGIVRSHHGFIEVATEPGCGTTFEVFLPAGEASPAGEVPVELPEAHGETILVVSGKPTVLSITAETLEAHGFDVLTATHPVEAISTFATHGSEVPVVCTDLELPGMDGPAMIAVLRRMQPDVKIVANTDKNIEAIGGGGAALGIAKLLPKPHSASDLIVAITAALQQRTL